MKYSLYESVFYCNCNSWCSFIGILSKKTLQNYKKISEIGNVVVEKDENDGG